ncbi:hypothetical protein [Patiriisocius marinus]|uniref:hypothetical protein n=1 Tax=Patiriisocius marinus TaxID=1397112 RepID=UPI00232ED322|nr:hypothetical protein [Patiriisocius marinus]
MNGYRSKQETEFKESWERTRVIVAVSLMPHLGKGKSRAITKIYPLPWDDEKGAEYAPIEHKKAVKEAESLWQKIDQKTKQ